MTATLMVSVRASVRVAQAQRWLSQRDAAAKVRIVSHSLEAAGALVRSLQRPVFGWERTTLSRLAAAQAAPSLASEGRVLATGLALDALWLRVVHQLTEAGELGRYAPIATRPGLVRAIGRTCTEARLGSVDASALEPELRRALERYEAALDEFGLADGAMVLSLACAAPPPTEPLLLLDVSLGTSLERDFVTRLAAGASDALAVAPKADVATVAALERALHVQAQTLELDAHGPLASLQRNLFSTRDGATDTWTDLLSTPGEGREAVELVRVIQQEAAKGVPFDQMGVLLRAPLTYRAALETAFRRAGVPAWFARGTSKPDPSSRALLALLRCAEDGLSARRFAEYLSLAQLPRADATTGAPPAAASDEARWEPGDDEALADSKTPPSAAPPDAPEDVEAPVVAGSLRAPRRWELLLIDAAVIGGLDRWKRRLAGALAKKQKARAAPDVSEAHAARLDRELSDLTALEHFAVPLLQELAQLPTSATWAVWLERLSSLATRALRRPARVLSMLQELAPMGVVGPVTVREVRAALTARFSEVTLAPTQRRAGRVFVGPIDAARGLSFEVVLVPGLVERVFPQKVREDPLLGEARRAELGLTVNADRIAAERLALQLAVGAATRRVVLSYPRLDAELGRPRVPSFYTLEAIQAVEGRLPGFEELQRRAEGTSRARLGWPAPMERSLAIDETEYDLSVLDELLRADGQVRGRARYLIDANPFLARALRARYARWAQRKWTGWDGLVLSTDEGRAALAPKQLETAAYSPTALQHYAACPYRFFLSAIVRLSPLELPEAIEQLGPLERGSLTHEVQFRLLSSLRDQGVAVRPETLDDIFAKLDVELAEVAATYKDDFAPAIERVWRDGIEATRADLREWLRRVAREPSWAPWRFELSFGLGASRAQQDPASVSEPVQLDEGVRLRGSIDLVERSTGGAVRATDYKTGRARAEQGAVVGGGRTLQPLLYAVTLEKLFPGTPVDSGRLFYCTQAGGFSEVRIGLSPNNRQALGQVVHAIRDSVKAGFLPAAPDADECTFCDFRAVCGPDEGRRTGKKSRRELEALTQVRRLP